MTKPTRPSSSAHLLEAGEYRYDLSDHHGPSLYYLSLPLRAGHLGKVAARAERDHPPARDGVVRPGDDPPFPALHPDDGAGRRGLELSRPGRVSRDDLFQPVLHPGDAARLFPGRFRGLGLALPAPSRLGLGGRRRPLRGHDVRDQGDVHHRLRRRRRGFRPGGRVERGPETRGRHSIIIVITFVFIIFLILFFFGR